MRFKTADGERLKRLARKYAQAHAELVLVGSRPPEEHWEVKAAYQKARKKLHEEIDRLTSIDMTPRDVPECF